MKNLFRLILLLCIFFQSCKNTKRYYEFNNRVQVLKAGSYNSEKRITIFPEEPLVKISSIRKALSLSQDYELDYFVEYYHYGPPIIDSTNSFYLVSNSMFDSTIKAAETIYIPKKEMSYSRKDIRTLFIPLKNYKKITGSLDRFYVSEYSNIYMKGDDLVVLYSLRKNGNF